eukprot:GFUD01079070.1.p1 GENE.GFUD01079070.1~~GFUD01079070.1.p1  ORF type:complete len:257 (+),score=89.51 GFUD01079070.1:440-1210(+)
MLFRCFLVCLALGCQTIALPANPSTPPSTTPSIPTSSVSTSTTTISGPDCKSQTECKNCLAIPGCRYVVYEEISEVCQPLSDQPPTDDPVTPKLYYNSTECEGPGEPDFTILPEPTNTTTAIPETTTSTSKPDTTSTTTISTTSTTTISTTTTTITSTTTSTTAPIPDTTVPDTTTPSADTTTTTTPATTTTTASSPTTSSSTEAPEPEPDTGKGHFDGWSFFGGILLTLGLAAIGLVGFKYYRLRSGTGGNYNRF